MVECLTRDGEAAGSSLTGVTAFCLLARHINLSSVLVQPRNTCPYITERLLKGRKRIKSNKTRKSLLSTAVIFDLYPAYNFFPENVCFFTSAAFTQMQFGLVYRFYHGTNTI